MLIVDTYIFLTLENGDVRFLVDACFISQFIIIDSVDLRNSYTPLGLQSIFSIILNEFCGAVFFFKKIVKSN